MENFTTDAKLCIERDVVVSKEEKDYENIVSEFDIVETCKWIEDNNFTNVCLQFPDDLLCVSVRIYEEIKNRSNIDLYILGDTSYASCCVDVVASMHVRSDAVVHYGHCCFSKTNIPVYIVLPKRSLDIELTISRLKNQIKSDDNTKLCLFYDAGFEYCKETLKKYWFSQYPMSCVAVLERQENPNRFLGRLLEDAAGNELPLETLKEYTCIYIGSRCQTLFNYTISIEAKEWLFHDPNSDNIESLNETMWSRRRRYLIEKCKDANVIGILVCKLAGDQTKDIISRMKKLCKVNGKKSYIVSVGKPNVAKLANFPEIDIYVMIACPENDLYSNRDFYRPIVYPYELEVALNSNREQYFTHHITDYDELLTGRRNFCEIDHIKETTDVSLITGKIRETNIESTREDKDGMELAEKQNWALENIGSNLQNKSWKGLEQNLGETEVKKAEQGRKGIPLQYSNEPE